MTATAPSRNFTAEHAKLAQAGGPAEDNLFESNPWYEWGPYLSERAWGPYARTTATAVMPGPGTPSAVGPAASTRCWIGAAHRWTVWRGRSSPAGWHSPKSGSAPS
jgi:hypothetical protein